MRAESLNKKVLDNFDPKPYTPKVGFEEKLLGANRLTETLNVYIKEYTCQICHNLSCDPVLCNECIIYFCKACFEKNEKCTECVNTIYKSIPRGRYEKYITIQANCKNSEFGCNIVMSVKDISDHERECEFAEYVCKHCSETIILKNYNLHLNSCSLLTETCQNGCGKELYLRDKQSHNCIAFLSQQIQFLLKENSKLKNQLNSETKLLRKKINILKRKNQNTINNTLPFLLNENAKFNDRLTQETNALETKINYLQTENQETNNKTIPLILKESTKLNDRITQETKRLTKKINYVKRKNRETKLQYFSQKNDQITSEANSLQLQPNSYDSEREKDDTNIKKIENQSLDLSNISEAVFSAPKNTGIFKDFETKQSFSEVASIDTKQSIYSMYITDIESKAIILTGHNNGKICLWDLNNDAQLVYTFDGYGKENWINSLLVWKIDGRDILISGSRNEKIKLWDLKDKTEIHSFNLHSDEVTSLVLIKLDDKDCLVSGSYDKTLIVWDLKARQILFQLRVESFVRCLLKSRESDTDYIFSGSSYLDYSIKKWDLKSKSCIVSKTLHNSSLSCLILTELGNEKVIVSGSRDKTILIWKIDLSEVKLKLIAPGLVHSLTSLIIDGNLHIACGSSNSSITIWDLSNSQGNYKTRTLMSHDDWIYYLGILKLGKEQLLVSGSHDKRFKLWKI